MVRLSPVNAAWLSAVACLSAAVIVAAVILIRRTRSFVLQGDRRSRDLAAVSADLKTILEAAQIHLDRLETGQQVVAAELQSWRERWPVGAMLSSANLDGVTAALHELREEVAGRGDGQAGRVASPPAADGDLVGLERETLRESWKNFCQNEQLHTALESAARDECWKESADALLTQLPKHVPDDLKPTLESVMAPARDYHNLVAKISLVPKIVSSEIPRLPNDAQELARSRELAQLLAMCSHSSFVRDCFNFRLKNWVVDTFLIFADLYLQRYQQLQIEKCEKPLEEGVFIVKQVLRIAAVEPIDVRLGETPFDSTRHIGRSTRCDARFSDGVIVGVVRNGFTEGGRQVVRQPEVIVNRTA
jgi:hypothetical protein